MTIIMHMSEASHLRLWQLISPTLPIGAYAYSQGMEYAVHADWIKDEADTTEWIQGLMQHSLATLDIPVLQRCYQAWQDSDETKVIYWSHFILAARGAAELRLEDQQLGRALATLLESLDLTQAAGWDRTEYTNFAAMFALACVHWNIDIYNAAQGYIWTWCENQVAAAIKLVPLGQTAGQRMLSQLDTHIHQAVDLGLSIEDDEISSSTPALGIASAQHETQYSRLFRS